nr:MAG: putative RNA-dependent RNA polymerase [Narnaviridae sp.]
MGKTGFSSPLEVGPATPKSIADLREAVRASIDRGCLSRLEKYFEISHISTRQTIPLEKIKEDLLETVTLPIGSGSRQSVLVNISRVRQLATKASLSSRERKKVRQDLCQDFGSEASKWKLWEILLILNQRKIPLPSLFGIKVGPHVAHVTDDPCRIRHVIGLADAVHLAMMNLGIKVSFPERIWVRTSGLPSCDWFRGRVRFKSVDRPGVRSFNRFTTKNRKFFLIQHYLPQFPPDLPEKFYVKIIKENLVDKFCVESGQERPRISIRNITLFPDATQSRLDNLFSSSRQRRVRFYKNLLESKSLCAPVGDDMIKEAYEKHRESLCRPPGEVLDVPQEFLRELFEYGVEVGKFVERIYDPHSTKVPNTRATVEKNRQQGGARKALSGNLEIQKGPLYLSLLDGATRVEPFVIGLFGPPGSGKTTLVTRLVSSIGQSLFPSLTGTDLVYSRSCSTKYWDDYSDQPIIVLDDLGQDPNDRSDLVEFEQLISTNRYILPMAHLEQKGKCFTSPIVICTSNLEFCSPLLDVQNRTVVEDSRAFWRRFHLPLLVRKESRRWVLEDQQLSPPAKFASVRPIWEESETVRVGQHFYKGDRVPGHTFASHWRNYNRSDLYVPVEAFEDGLSLLNRILARFRTHVDFHSKHLSGTWRQEITCFRAEVHQATAPFYDIRVVKEPVGLSKDSVTASIHFPEFPPFHAPRVEAVAIPEPLKVRMITKAEAETKALQPFQRALFSYLKSKPQFVLTHGVSWGTSKSFDEKLEWIYRIQEEIRGIRDRSSEGDLWLSGDYTAATDNFPLSVTNALTEGILSQISHEPTRAWVRYEVSPHRIKYPGGIEDLQTSGQLMGSLLSFPLLCFLNDFIVSRSGFEPGKYLINGDDVVARGRLSTINRWKENAPKVGLDLSIGKNFIDPDFCCVNSQLFWDGNVQHTGKVSCQTRYGKSLSYCYSESQFYYGFSEDLRREFIRRNLLVLRDSPRSLDVPTTHGGLGLIWARRPGLDVNLAKRVFLHDWLRPFDRSDEVPGFDYLRALQVPTGIFTDSELELGGGPDLAIADQQLLLSLNMDPPEAESSDLDHATFRKREQKYVNDETSRLWNQLLAPQCPFMDFPRSDLLRTRPVFVQKGRVGFLKKRVQALALRLLLDFIRGDVGRSADEAFVEIQRDLLTYERCPLFSEAFPFSVTEWTDEELERYSGAFPDLPSKVFPGFSFPGSEGIPPELLLPIQTDLPPEGGPGTTNQGDRRRGNSSLPGEDDSSRDENRPERAMPTFELTEVSSQRPSPLSGSACQR